MAVTVILGSPIIVTGTTNTTDKVIDMGFGGAVFVKFIKWHKPTTIGHLCTLTDANGREIITFDCEVADESQWAPIFSYFQNIYCTDMDSGKLYIYTK
jgi:hypothetical protein